MFFPLKFTATLSRAEKSVDKLGQPNVDNWATIETPNCLFYAVAGTKEKVGREDYKVNMAFYVSPTSSIQEGDRVTDIKDAFGAVIEAGPLEVLSAKRVVSHLSGHVHHISCKVVGLA
jgi:hypothetical protein